MPSRWDHLFDLKPMPLMDHLLQEVARLVANELARWPPPVEELDLELGGAFAPLFEEGSRRPSRAVYAEALRLATWELERELAAYDDYLRNKRYLEHGLVAEDRRALLFLSRWLVEQMLGLGEATQGRVKRPQMLDALERLRRLLEAAQAPSSGG